MPKEIPPVEVVIEEPRNVVVYVLQPRTLIRRALCASGRCDFLLTASEAKDLEAIGKVRIEGIASPIS